jgi:hypothetical protein
VQALMLLKARYNADDISCLCHRARSDASAHLPELLGSLLLCSGSTPPQRLKICLPLVQDLLTLLLRGCCCGCCGCYGCCRAAHIHVLCCCTVRLQLTSAPWQHCGVSNLKRVIASNLQCAAFSCDLSPLTCAVMKSGSAVPPHTVCTNGTVLSKPTTPFHQPKSFSWRRLRHFLGTPVLNTADYDAARQICVM